ncbi:tannase and feruloyl esterase [Amniculicola lignicola CBS 123094]|uniref:Carboxylic ester hydrolase n=1 Tax=Amniculicola lignicola CBS 123094 TaxID=1392246 RepID=A0A6A5WLJ6_9PLEO|nr:tannase and feruloyl esterase [Amniculicola lignicola CBS 123094]
MHSTHGALAMLALAGTISAQDTYTPPKCTSSTFIPPVIPGAEVTSITAAPQHNVSTDGMPGMLPGASSLDLCEVKVHLTHPNANDDVLVEIWLPLNPLDWNGRFQATGGGGYATGLGPIFLGHGVGSGYATSMTDGGHALDPFSLTWVLNPDRSINWELLRNFATRSLVDQIVVGKLITEQYYGEKPHHSYWHGCSMGGRQGYMIAQKYPDLLDGILANAPAIKLTHAGVGGFWPQVVMKEEGVRVPGCVFEHFIKRWVETCDELDGVNDGVVEDPDACDFTAGGIVGEKIQCEEEGAEVEITKEMGDVLKKSHEGPTTPLGHAFYTGLYMEGSLTEQFFRVMLIRDLDFNSSKIGYADFMALWAQANVEFGWLLNAEDPDLRPLQKAGGKLLTWHGLMDYIIPAPNTLSYRKRVEFEMGGSKAVNEFYRVFFAPGVGHCGLGAGPMPTNPFEQLVDWVEKGEAPEALEAEASNEYGELVTRDICLYPRKSKYMGVGDPKRASSWTCEGADDVLDDPDVVDQSTDFLGGLKDRLMGLGMGLRIS